MMASCTAGTVACWITSQADILRNIAASLEPIQQLITGVAYVMGIAFAFKAIYSLKVYGEARTMMSSNASLKEPVTYLVVSAVFIYLPRAMKVLLMTTFGDTDILPYAPINSSNGTLDALFGSNSPVGASLSLFIQVIGLIAFIRGWVLIARAAGQGGQPGTTGKGLMHVFGGILAINIVKTLEIINNTLYG
ncbi:type IV secretion protein IcmC [Legionella sp. W05-934-2]|uniref:type IV secretion protein IcmC n=1 Tax=Legionella sp. W05-934-2 TaxID=1198649 RepID=UPI0034620772